MGRILGRNFETFVNRLDGLIDVYSSVGNLIGGVACGVSPYVKKVECNSSLVQVRLEEVSPQPHLFDLKNIHLEDSIWSKTGLVATI